MPLRPGLVWLPKGPSAKTPTKVDEVKGGVGGERGSVLASTLLVMQSPLLSELNQSL